MSKIIKLFKTQPLLILAGVVLLLLLFNRIIKKAFNMVSALISNAIRKNNTVQGEAGSGVSVAGSSPVNLFDTAQIIYNSLTNFGLLIYGGLFTDGEKVVNVLSQVPKMYISQLATIYATNHQRNLYSDLLNGLTSSEYNSIKHLVI